jgi:hypothetical protein
LASEASRSPIFVVRYPNSHICKIWLNPDPSADFPAFEGRFVCSFSPWSRDVIVFLMHFATGLESLPFCLFALPSSFSLVCGSRRCTPDLYFAIWNRTTAFEMFIAQHSRTILTGG